MFPARVLRFAVVSLTLVSLGGCGFLFESRAERAMRRTPDFKSGYGDGCATASAMGTNFGRNRVRDEDLYKAHKAYRAGWAAGVSACQSTLSGQPGVPRNPIPDVNPGMPSH